MQARRDSEMRRGREAERSLQGEMGDEKGACIE
jgi:hypothetical protein